MLVVDSLLSALVAHHHDKSERKDWKKRQSRQKEMMAAGSGSQRVLTCLPLVGMELVADAAVPDGVGGGSAERKRGPS